jgi:UPF0716 protein FxsA
MGLLVLIYPFAEIYAFYRFIEAYSFFDAVFFVILSSAAGAMIVRLLGPSTLSLAQGELSKGRVPANKILHRALALIGGFLLFFPGIISDIIGVLFILPGSRHLIAFYIKHLIRKGIFKGKVFMSGMGTPGGFGRTGGFGRSGGFNGDFGSQGFPRGPQGWEEPRTERDAQVVDIEPLEISHKNLPSDDDSGNSKS